MSYFVCPHCNQEIDIFSKGGVSRTAQQFGVSTGRGVPGRSSTKTRKCQPRDEPAAPARVRSRRDRI